jgi:hypothetical protein
LPAQSTFALSLLASWNAFGVHPASTAWTSSASAAPIRVEQLRPAEVGRPVLGERAARIDLARLAHAQAEGHW